MVRVRVRLALASSKGDRKGRVDVGTSPWRRGSSPRWHGGTWRRDSLWRWREVAGGDTTRGGGAVALGSGIESWWRGVAGRDTARLAAGGDGEEGTTMRA